jgi:hypothetical protein
MPAASPAAASAASSETTVQRACRPEPEASSTGTEARDPCSSSCGVETAGGSGTAGRRTSARATAGAGARRERVGREAGRCRGETDTTAGRGAAARGRGACATTGPCAVRDRDDRPVGAGARVALTPIAMPPPDPDAGTTSVDVDASALGSGSGGADAASAGVTESGLPGVAAGGGGEAAGAVGAGGAGGASGAGGRGAPRDGSSVSGSTYLSSAATRTPRWTYGTACSASPVGPASATTSPSDTIDPRWTRSEPTWVSDTLWTPVSSVTVSPLPGIMPAKVTSPETGARTKPPLSATSTPRCWPAAYASAPRLNSRRTAPSPGHAHAQEVGHVASAQHATSDQLSTHFVAR